MAVTPGVLDFKRQFQLCPIYLTGGAAGNLAGGTLPITALLQGSSFASLLSGGEDINLDSFFAHFYPLPGKHLISQQLGTYPFANQATAANAVITQPLNVALDMICPAREAGSYSEKQAVLSALKSTLDQHNASGGTYAVNTPSFLYTDCVLKELVDVTSGESKQVEWRWRWVFEKPLISMQDAQNAQNNLMGKISSGTQVSPAADGEVKWSTASNTIGDPSSGAAGPVVPGNVPSSGLSFGSSAPEGDANNALIPASPSGAAVGSFVGQNSDVTGFTVPF